jgi:D-xylose 1-dehydrogenase (NADP+, D-xylono-1,5-lactone-forming)
VARLRVSASIKGEKVSNKLLNWGLLSTAKINKALMPALKGSKRNRLLAVASRSQESADAYAKQWGIERALGSYEALLADPEIDVVYVSLPNHLHAEWSIRALRAGKHVLCEKPLALNPEQVDRMSDAAGEAGRVLAEAFMYRHHPQTLLVKEMVDRGDLGMAHLIKAAFTFTVKREGDIRLKKETGGGSIWDVGCYPISYARLIAGTEPDDVAGWQSAGPEGADMLFVGQMRFPNGMFAQFDSSLISASRSYMEIVGSEGVLNIPNPFKPGLEEKLVLTRGDTVQQIAAPGAELYSGEVEDMADAILLGKQPRLSLADSRGTIEAITRLLQSAGSDPIADFDL